MHQMFMVWLTLLLALRGTESSDFCFDASMEGFRLNSTILKKVDVSNKMECVVSCVKESCCRSINYREKLPQDIASLCEMLHDVVDKPTAKLEKNRFYDYIFFNAPLKDYDGNCVTEKDPTQEFDLEFPSKDIKNYVLLDNNVPEMSNMTLMFWINIVDAGKMTVLVYNVYNAGKSKSDLRVFVQKDVIYFVFRSNYKLKFLVPPINDGYWHHVGVAWSFNQYSIYLDGILVYSGLGSGRPIRAGGVFAIGQRVSNTNGEWNADNSFSFVGKLSQLNMWDYDYISSAGIDMKSISQSCSNPVGNIINWSVLRDRASGMVEVKEKPRSCEPLRKNSEYDIIINSTQDISTKPLKNVQNAFTIALWEKRLYHNEASIKYVGYSSNSDKILLAVYSVEDVFHLDIDNLAGTPIHGEARVPTYRDNYWHHIATTWSNKTGNWMIYLDGSLVSIMHGLYVSDKKFPEGKQLSERHPFLAFSGQLSRLNIWNYKINGHILSLMAIKGPTFENGNLFAWYGVKSKVETGVIFEETPSDLNNSRSRAVHQMNFPEASTENFARIENVFPNDIAMFTACFWAKIRTTECGIFTYSLPSCDDEIAAFFYHSNHRLDLIINGEYNYQLKGFVLIIDRPTILTYQSWHFYCMQWNSLDGLVKTYQDAIKFDVEYNKAKDHVIPKNGAIVLGQELNAYASGFNDNQAFKGSLAGLNFWSYLLNEDTIQGMAAGIINVNGNLLQWRNFTTHHVHGDVSIVKRSEVEIPEYRVQALRDKWCKNNTPPDLIYARFARNQHDGYQWRCVTPMAMLKENMCYDTSKNSIDYYTRGDILPGIN